MPPSPLIAGASLLVNCPSQSFVPNYQFSPWRLAIHAPIRESSPIARGQWAIFSDFTPSCFVVEVEVVVEVVEPVARS